MCWSDSDSACAPKGGADAGGGLRARARGSDRSEADWAGPDDCCLAAEEEEEGAAGLAGEDRGRLCGSGPDLNVQG